MTRSKPDITLSVSPLGGSDFGVARRRFSDDQISSIRVAMLLREDDFFSAYTDSASDKAINDPRVLHG